MPPSIEICIVGDSGCVCHDNRLPKEQQDYIRTFEECVNYIATNPNDYATMQEWMIRKCRK